MLKQLILDSPVYKKFFEISFKVLDDLENDAKYLEPIKNKIFELKELVETNMNYVGSFDEDMIISKSGKLSFGTEVFARIAHYVVLDNSHILKQYFDDSEESKQLQDTKLGVYEVMEINKDNVVLLTNDGEKITIVGEGTGSEFRIGKKIKQGDVIVSRLIKLQDGWYIMKNFYYLLQDIQKDGFDILKVAYKQTFQDIKDMLDMEERVQNLNDIFSKISRGIDRKTENINYAKKIKNILLGYLNKKQTNQAIKILKNVDSADTIKEFISYIEQFNIPENRFKELMGYVTDYLNSVNFEKAQKEGDTYKTELIMRLELITPDLMNYINKKGILPDDIKSINKAKEEWFNTPNPIIGNKTPLEFLQEVDSNYSVENLQLIKNKENTEDCNMSKIVAKMDNLIKFRDYYEISKTLEENKHCTEKNQGFKFLYVYMNYNFLMNEITEHKITDLSRLNYLVNIFYSLQQQFFSLTEEYEKGLVFDDRLKEDLEQILYNNNIGEIITNNFLLSDLYISYSEYLIENNKKEEALNVVKTVIKDFDVDKFIQLIRKKQSILDVLEYYKTEEHFEVLLINTLLYLWTNYKDKGEILFDEIFYKIKYVVGVYDEEYFNKEKLVKDLTNIIYPAKETIKKGKKIKNGIKKILFKEDIKKLKEIKDNINDKELKSKFIESMELLGIF